MDVIKLLNYLQEIIENSSKIPITGKVLVDKKEVMDVIDEIINYLPDEFKKAQWVVEEKERILSEAIRESDSIKKESVGMLKKHIENHDITKEATARAEQIIAAAQRDSKSMRLGARDYADEVLSQLDREITCKGQEMIVNLKGDMEVFMDSLNSEVQSTGNTIRCNIEELRNIK
jgi:cell division septum initiation protein DivIVA